MTLERKPSPPQSEVRAGLDGLVPLAGGFWSSAYACRAGDDELVLRLGRDGARFAIDAAAMQLAAPHLPVPDVLDVGRALGLHFAVSRRHHGQFIETREATCSDAVCCEPPRLAPETGSRCAPGSVVSCQDLWPPRWQWTTRASGPGGCCRAPPLLRAADCGLASGLDGSHRRSR